MGDLASVEQATADAVEPTCPLLFHVHGIGRFDFSSMECGDLAEVDKLAASRGVQLVPTVFLRRQYLPTFRRVLTEYVTGKREGRFDRILGFGVEGPLLGSSGGVPEAGCWTPDAAEWMALAELGLLGLSYIVMAPDGLGLTEEIEPGLIFRDVIDAFYLNGVKLALGHFRHDAPELSARRTERVIDYIQARYGPSPLAVITDHLYNDMPRRFTHAWRSPDEKARRDAEVREFLAEEWSLAELAELLGPVPAVLLRAAAEDRLTPTLNFDGEHVDLEVCRRTIELLGAERLIAITDDTESTEMAGESLSRKPGSTLLYRDDGRVAAGSSGALVQERNLRSLGLGEADRTSLLGGVARAVLDADARAPRATPGSVAATRWEDGNAALVERYLVALRQVSATVDAAALGALVETVVEALRSGRGVFLAGNGGSAATVTHMAGDWSRAAVLCGIRPVRVCGLSDNLASLTGLANDIGYSRALAERLLESAQTGDLLVMLSVSGASPNLIDLARAGREAGMNVVALLGLPGPIASLVDSWAAVGTGDYGLVEDLHLAVNHMVIRALSDEALPGCCPTELERCAAGGAAIPGAVG